MTLSIDDALGRYFVNATDGRSLMTGGWLDTGTLGPQAQFLSQADAQAAVTTYTTANGTADGLAVTFAQVPDGTVMNGQPASISHTDRALRDAITTLTARVAFLEKKAGVTS
jgi:hypothetical protein